ncbi:glutamine synthetase beta-grasp domain-containing protein [Streptomyces thinghirensis]|nr:glutamine synthetase beta-grasp domain-containing protein [Streptomyces thinghirensis]
MEQAFDEGIGFDGSAIEGFARVYESDMIAKPDPSTFQVLPWRAEAPGTARMFCDILMPDGSPVLRRPALRPQAPLARTSDLGFTFYTHPEIEFFLLKDKPVDGTVPTPADNSGYFDHTPQNIGTWTSAARRSPMLESMGISVEFSHHEGAPASRRIDLRYADALSGRLTS